MKLLNYEQTTNNEKDISVCPHPRTADFEVILEWIGKALEKQPDISSDIRASKESWYKLMGKKENMEHGLYFASPKHIGR